MSKILVAAEAELKALMVRSLAGDGAAYAELLRRLQTFLRAYYLRVGWAGRPMRRTCCRKP